MDRERFRSENLVRHDPDRPAVQKTAITGGYAVDHEDQMSITSTLPLTPFRLVRGHAIGGGTSREALRRAKRNCGRKR